MEKKHGNAEPVSEVEEPPSGAEFIMGSANWNERLASARLAREKALSKRAEPGEFGHSTNANRILSPRDQTGPNSSVDSDADEEAPSIEEILTTANWNDRIAKATARREHIINERRPKTQAQVSPVPEDLSQPYKDVVRGAFSGLAPSLRTQKENTAALSASVADATLAESNKRLFSLLQLSTIVGILLVIGLIIPSPFRNFATGAINSAVTAFVGPEIASAPRVGQQTDVTTVIELPVVLLNDTPIFNTLENDRFSSQSAEFVLSPPGQEIGLVVSKKPYADVPGTELTASPSVSTSLTSIENFQNNSSTDAQFGAAVELSAVTKEANPGKLSATNSYDAILTQIPLLADSSPFMMSIAPQFANALVPDITSANISGHVFTINAWQPKSATSILANPSISDLSARAPVPIKSITLRQEIAVLSISTEPGLSKVLLPQPFEIGTKLTAVNSVPILPLNEFPLTKPEPVDRPEGASAAITLSGNYSIHLRAPSSLPDEQLGAFATALRETGFSVNDPKRVGFTVSKNHVRFYHPNDAEAAGLLAAAVDGVARDFTDYRPSPPAGTIEVWLAGKNASRANPTTNNRSSNQNPALTNLRNRLLQSLRRGDHL